MSFFDGIIQPDKTKKEATNSFFPSTDLPSQEPIKTPARQDLKPYSPISIPSSPVFSVATPKVQTNTPMFATNAKPTITPEVATSGSWFDKVLPQVQPTQKKESFFDSILKRNETISAQPTSSKAKQAYDKYAPPIVKSLVKDVQDALYGSGQQVDFAGNLKEDVGFLGGQFGSMKSNFARVDDRYKKLVENGVDPERATKIATQYTINIMSDPLSYLNKKAVQEKTIKDLNLTDTENSALNTVGFLESVNTALDTLNFTGIGSIEKVAFKKIAEETYPLAIKQILTKEIRNIPEKLADDLSRVLSKVNDPKEVKNILDKVDFSINKYKPVSLFEKPPTETPVPKGQSVDTQPIYQEAKKYQSLEEFIKAQGEPVYHGTNADFTQFDPKMIGKRDSGWFGKGFYFAGTKGEAGTYGKNVMESYLKLKKPFDFSSFSHPDFKGYSFADGYYISNLAKVVPEIGNKLKVSIADEIPTEKNDYKRFVKDIPFREYESMVKKENLSKESKRFIDEKGVQYYSYKDIYGNEKDMKFSNGMKIIPNEILDYALFNKKYEVDTNTGYLYGVEKEIADKLGDSFTNKLKKLGYDGTIQSPEGDEYVAFSPDQIKTKSQLTEIWNKANIPSQPKAPTYQGEKDLSITSLEKLKGRPEDQKLPIVFYSDLAKQGDLKQQERDIINNVLSTYPEGSTIPVKEFADKVKTELLPLDRNSSENFRAKIKELEKKIEATGFTVDEDLDGSVFLTDKNGEYADYDQLPKDVQKMLDSYQTLAKEGQGKPRQVGFEQVSLPKESRGQVANYSEIIYESPIKTSAGDVHFPARNAKGYFGHTRIEDMADNNTRRVIEVQSDLFQKGNLERETDTWSVLKGDESINKIGEEEHQKRLAIRRQEVSKLQQYSNPTAHFRMVREEVKKAAQDGKTKLQFPTGETAMKIEGLSRRDMWYEPGRGTPLNASDLSVGKEIYEAASRDQWVVTEILENGKFKAVPKRMYGDAFEAGGGGMDRVVDANRGQTLRNFEETFDISGKVDTNNPIYRFYEKDLGRYLTSKYGAKMITDPKGVKWYEVNVKPEEASKPVTAFKKPLFSRQSGPKVDTETAKKLLAEIITDNKVRLAFRENLIDGFATGKYSRPEDLLRGILRPLIEIYQEGGKVEVKTAYHEAYHYLFDQIFTDAERKVALETARKNISIADRAKYFLDGYGLKDQNKILQEYLADQYAEQKAREGGFTGPYKSIFERMEEIIKGILDTAKKLFNRAKEAIKGNTQEPNNVNYKRVGDPREYDVSKKKEEPTQVAKFKNPIEEKINELTDAISFTEDAIKNNPARTLSKYANRNGELPEVLGSGIGHGYFKTHGDDLVTELGFEDSEMARDAYQNYRLQVKRLADQKLELKKVKLAFQNTRTLEKDAKAISVFLEKSFAKEGSAIANNAKKNADKPLESQQALERRKKLAEKHLHSLIGATYSTTSPLERESSEHMLKLTEQAYNMSLGEFERLNEETSFKKIVSTFQTPVNKRIGILDYLRTPDRVLKKIGLPNTSNLLRHSYESYLAELPLHIDLISAWAKRVDPKANEAIFNYLDGQTNKDHFGDKVHTKLAVNEMKVATEIKAYLAEWADRLGLPEDDKISHYITHIFGLGEGEKEFDEDLAKIITDKVTGSVYDPFLQKRLGAKGYLRDPWKALDAYVKRAVRKANMDPVLERLSADAEHLELSQMKYVKRLTDRVNMRPTEIDSAIDNTIKNIIGYKFGARPTAYLSRTARQIIFRYALGANLNSAIKNLTQGVNTYSKLGEKYTLIGYTKMLTSFNHTELNDVGIFGQDMIQDRKLSSTKKALEKIDNGLFLMFEVAEKINRGSAYYGAKAKALAEGKSELEAMQYAKKMVRDTQFQFGSIDTPVGLNSDITKLLTQFLTYGVKQIEFVAETVSNKEWAGIIRYIIASTVIVYLFGESLNIKWSDYIPGYSFLKFGGPPALALPLEVTKAVADMPDRFGNSRTLMQKITDVGDQVPFPAGVQIKKSIGGISTFLSKTPSKKVEQNSYNFIKSLVLGKQNIETKKSIIKKIYDNNQQLIKDGKQAEANTITKTLSDEDYSVYNKIKASEKAKATNELKKKVQPIYDKAQDLKASGKTKEADDLVRKLTDEEYKAYVLIKKSLNP